MEGGEGERLIVNVNVNVKESGEIQGSVGPMIFIGRWENTNFQVPIG
jgi:hypothetical protein